MRMGALKTGCLWAVCAIPLFTVLPKANYLFAKNVLVRLWGADGLVSSLRQKMKPVATPLFLQTDNHPELDSDFDKAALLREIGLDADTSNTLPTTCTLAMPIESITRL